MSIKSIELISNPSVQSIKAGKIPATISQLADPKIIQHVLNFHQSLPDYQITPLVNLTCLAKQLSIKELQVKDESFRFSLNAFKALGASFAMANILAEQLNLSHEKLNFNRIVEQKKLYKNIQFATTTDGNHGKAVAWAAQLFGCQSHIFMPKGSSKARVNAIKFFTDHVTVTDMNYDDTVNKVNHLSKQNAWQLIQDTAWQGYSEIPDNIMRGYFSLITEMEQQEQKFWPSHVFLQAGVGSLAAAIAAYFVANKKPIPIFIIVEPKEADCFFQSVKANDGLPHPTQGKLNTLMAGLACGVPSLTAWKILKQSAKFFIRCDDRYTKQGICRYANPVGDDRRIISGESAAVTLGLLETIMRDPNYNIIRQELALDSNSKVLLLSTEGNTDDASYRNILATCD